MINKKDFLTNQDLEIIRFCVGYVEKRLVSISKEMNVTDQYAAVTETLKKLDSLFND